MDFVRTLENYLQKAVVALGSTEEVCLLPPEDPQHGDLTTPIAFVLAKILRRPPFSIAEELADHLRTLPMVHKAEVMNKGFLNIWLKESLWPSLLPSMLNLGKSYGANHHGKSQKINVEYVSANPTGPLHAGHLRGAIIGDVLANLLTFSGYEVTKEYYINDAGHQVEVLAHSVYAHYVALLKKVPVVIPSGAYPGEYIKTIAEAFLDKEGDVFLDNEPGGIQKLCEFAVAYLMDHIKRDMGSLNITYDVFTSEKAIQSASIMTEVFDRLTADGLVYWGHIPDPKKDNPDFKRQEKPLFLFRSTAFGDDQDRPLKRADGSWTYFATDIAYHMDKYLRGYSRLIDVWGADHGGHVIRMKAALEALTGQSCHLDVILCQIVNFRQNGKPFKMSKRAGTFITVQDILETVSQEALRFMLASKKADSHFDFDLEKIQEETKDNPFFYVQYAYARCQSVLKAAQALFSDGADQGEDCHEMDSEYYPLIKILADWPRQVHQATLTQEPHRITLFILQVATAFHGVWQQGKVRHHLRFLLPDDPKRSWAHIQLVRAVALVLRNGLGLLGITPQDEM